MTTTQELLSTNRKCMAYFQYAMLMYYNHKYRNSTSIIARNEYDNIARGYRYNWMQWEARLMNNDLDYIMREVNNEAWEYGLETVYNNAVWMLNESTKSLKHNSQLVTMR